jgi:hypothetical protein
MSIGLSTTLVSWSVMAIGIGTNDGAIALTGLLGAVITPSAGAWYAGSSGAGWLGMRAAGATVMFLGLVNLAQHEDGGSRDGAAGPGAELLLGAGLLVAGTVADIATAPSAARRHNRELRRLAVAPMIHGGGGGLVIGGRF